MDWRGISEIIKIYATVHANFILVFIFSFLCKNHGVVKKRVAFW